MKKGLTNTFKFVLFLSFGLILLYLVYHRLDIGYQQYCSEQGIPPGDCKLWQRVLNDFAGANYFWITIALICFLISNISRAIQWNLLLEPVSHRPRTANTFLAVMLGYFANLGLPRMGEFIRSGAISNYEKIPYETVFGTVVTSRIVDMICLAGIALLAFSLEFEKILDFSRQYIFTGPSSTLNLAILAVGGVLTLVAFILLLKNKSDIALFRKIREILNRFKYGVFSILNLKNTLAFIFHTLVIWTMYVLMTYLGFFAYAPTAHLSFQAGLTAFVIGSLGFVLPAPGGMGAYHALIIIALAFYGIDELDGFSYAMILFITLQIFANVLLGLLALILLPRINKNYKPLKKEHT